jgi:fused signal recognition particle receptor
MGIEVIFLVLAVLVVAFGIGVVVVNRRNAASSPTPTSRPTRPTAPPPEAGGAPAGTLVEERPDELVEAEPEPEPEPEPVRPASLRDRLSKARLAFTGAVAGVLGRSGITDESFEDLEEALLRADVGVGVTTELLDGLRARVASKEITEPQALLDELEAEMVSRLDGADRSLTFEPGEAGSPNVWMFVGVNGVGKTTTIGKLSNQQIRDGRTVLMAAGDTFRAAAAEQLTTWAERSGAEIVRGAEGSDPSAVIFDGVERASARNIELVMADTAGRLHTKSNLMEELKKVRRVAEKGAGRVTETLLVIDATTGQNGLTQAREFGEATNVTGVVLTKLDGSAKGGIVFAIETELGIPVKLVGIGETIEDLIPFDPAEFVSALVTP